MYYVLTDGYYNAPVHIIIITVLLPKQDQYVITQVLHVPDNHISRNIPQLSITNTKIIINYAFTKYAQ